MKHYLIDIYNKPYVIGADLTSSLSLLLHFSGFDSSNTHSEEFMQERERYWSFLYAKASRFVTDTTQVRTAIDGDKMKAVGLFLTEDTEPIQAMLQSMGKWEEVLPDQDGDLVLYRES